MPQFRCYSVFVERMGSKGGQKEGKKRKGKMKRDKTLLSICKALSYIYRMKEDEKRNVHIYNFSHICEVMITFSFIE